MKKLIYSLSIAMAAGAMANAAPSATIMSRNSLEGMNLMKAQGSFVRISSDKQELSTRASAASSVNDFLGNWNWEGTSMLADEDGNPTDNGLPFAGIMTISLNPDNTSKVIVSGFNPFGDLEGYYDSSNGHLVIPNQFQIMNDDMNQEIWFYNYTVENYTIPTGPYAGENTYMPVVADDAHPFYFVVRDNGRLYAGDPDPDKYNNNNYTDAELLEDLCLGADIMPNFSFDAFFWLCFNARADRLSDFTFISDEWQYVGLATFQDAWYQAYWEGGVAAPYDVPLYFKKSTPGTYMLYDPYGVDTPYGIPTEDGGTINVDPTKVGYLIFDLSDADCVTFSPMIYSATLGLDFGEGVSPEALYNFNEEGYLYEVELSPKSEIRVTLGRNNTSYLDTRNTPNQVYIKNAYSSVGINPSSMITWGDQFTREGYIQLPENWVDAVDTILGEENVPVEYYNVQGVRVLNPERGQLVIVRKGAKATKQVIR